MVSSMLIRINTATPGGGVMAQARAWLSAEEAAQRLDVKPATLYAYVSRGVLSRRRTAGGRSLFDPAEVDRLRRRGGSRQSTGGAEVVIRSAITALGPDRPFYRGRDATELAGWASFEAIAGWLWTGDPDHLAAPPDGNVDWSTTADAVAAARAAQSGLPADVLALERLQVIAAALGATDPMRNNLDPAAVVGTGRRLIAGMIAGLPGPDHTPRYPGDDIASRLCAKLAPDAATSRLAGTALVDAVRTALVLLADHELAASTLAVRVAASVRADPYSAILAGLGTLSGPLHGAASLGAESLLAEATGPDQVPELIGLRLRRGDRIPGFGHAVYRPTDARAGVLLDRIRAAVASSTSSQTVGGQVLAVADAVLAEAARRGVPAPNVDVAVAVLTRSAGMPVGSGEAIFAVARTAGWLAHAMEEYQQRTPLRLRAVYIGPS
jgi:citrate synthase